MMKKILNMAVILVFSSPVFSFYPEKVLQLQADPSNDGFKAEALAEVNQQKKAMDRLLELMKSPQENTDYRCALSEVALRSDNAKAQKEAVSLMGENKDLDMCLSTLAGQYPNKYAQEALLANLDGFMSDVTKGKAEKDLKKKISAINSIWSLGQLGDYKVIDKLNSYYNQADEVIRINIVMSMGKLKDGKALEYIKKIALNPNEKPEVRSAAFEMIDEINGGK